MLDALKNDSKFQKMNECVYETNEYNEILNIYLFGDFYVGDLSNLR